MHWPTPEVVEILNASKIKLAAAQAAESMARDLLAAGEEIQWPWGAGFRWHSEAFGHGAHVVVLRVDGVEGEWISNPYTLRRAPQ